MSVDRRGFDVFRHHGDAGSALAGPLGQPCALNSMRPDDGGRQCALKVVVGLVKSQCRLTLRRTERTAHASSLE